MEAVRSNVAGEQPAVITLSKKDAAKALSISVSTLDRITRKGAIAVCRIGRRKVFTLQALNDYVSQTERKQRAA